MVAAYGDALRTSRRPDRVKRDQTRFARDRASCGENRRCLQRAYDQRTAELRDNYRGGGDAGQGGGGGNLAALRRRMSETYDDELSRIRRSDVRAAFNARHLRWNDRFKQCGNSVRCQKQWYREYTALLRDPQERQRLRERANAGGGQGDGNLSALANRMSVVYRDELSRIRRADVRAAFNQRHLQWNSQFKQCGNNVRCKKRWYREYTALLRDPEAKRRLRQRGVRRKSFDYGPTTEKEGGQ